MRGYVINLDIRPDRLEDFRKYQLPFEVERIPAIETPAGQDGCYLSHLIAIQKQTEFPFVVFEDDCVLVKPWSTVVKIMKQLPPDWDGLWLGATLKRPLLKYSKNLYKLRFAYALHAVIYGSKRMVDYIVKNNNRRPGDNIDVFYRNHVMPNFNCFITYPLIAIQKSDYSDIGKGITGHSEEMTYVYHSIIKR